MPLSDKEELELMEMEMELHNQKAPAAPLQASSGNAAQDYLQNSPNLKKGLAYATGVGEGMNPLNIPHGLETLGRAALKSPLSRVIDAVNDTASNQPWYKRVAGVPGQMLSEASSEALIPEVRVSDVAPYLRAGARGIGALATGDAPEFSDKLEQEQARQKAYVDMLPKGWETAGELTPAIVSAGATIKSLAKAGGVGEAAQAAANEARVNALGGGKAQVQQLMDNEFVQPLGQFLGDEKIVGPLTSRGKILENLQNSQAKYGKQIGDIVEQSDALNAAEMPKAIPGAMRRVRRLEPPPPQNWPTSLEEAPTYGGPKNLDYLQYNPEAKVAQSGPWERFTGYGAGSTDPVTFEHATGPSILPIEKTAVPKLAERFIDPQELVNEARAQIADPLVNSDLGSVRKAGSALQADLDVMANKYKPGSYISFKQAQDLAKQIRDEKGIYSGPQSNKAAIGAYEGFYQLLRDKEKNAIGALGESEHLNLRDPFETAAGNYAKASGAENIAAGKVAREFSNRAVSPTDYAAAIIGSHGGNDPMQAAINASKWALLNKLGRQYGNQLSASGWQALANSLKGSPNNLNKFGIASGLANTLPEQP